MVCMLYGKDDLSNLYGASSLPSAEGMILILAHLADGSRERIEWDLSHKSVCPSTLSNANISPKLVRQL